MSTPTDAPQAVPEGMGSAGTHRWSFFRAGGLDQVMFRNGQDLARIGELDPKLWVVLSCPASGVQFDTRTLEMIDTDRDGRVRVPELVAAAQWIASLLRDPDALMAGSAVLPLSAIDGRTALGAQVLATARRILASIGKADSPSISLDHIAERVAALSQMRLNGDGVVPPESADDAGLRDTIREILGCVGGVLDRSGTLGINREKADAFFEACRRQVAWRERSETDPSILSLGSRTADAAAAWQAVRSKVDDFFARCRLAQFHPQAAASLNAGDADFLALTRLSLTLSSPEISQLPLASIGPGRSLPMSDGLNPFWAAAIGTLRVQAAEPLLQRSVDALTESEWGLISARLAPYAAWMAVREGSETESLGLPRLRELLASGVRDRIEALIRSDSEQECEHALTEAVERAIRYHRDLLRLLNNFVSFADFYNPDRDEMFHVGRLYVAARFCDLCVQVDNVDRHSLLSSASKLFLAYCELSDPATGRKRFICAAFTAGVAETLWVGRNGIFYDNEGHCWEAVIVKVVDGPIGLREAFWAPWKKMSMMISEQVRKLLAARQEAAMAAAARSVAESAARATGAAVPTPPPPPPKMDGAAMASSVAAVGIAVGLLGSAVGGLLGTMSKLPVWKSLLGVFLVILAVSGPAVILAYFKLRARDLAPVLNACGWAVNRRIRITMLLGRVFTQEARLPPDAERMLTDPYADKNRVRNLLIALLLTIGAVVVLWWFGHFNPVLPPWLQVQSGALSGR